MSKRGTMWLALLLAAAVAVRGERWTDSLGRQIEGEVVGAYGSFVAIAGKKQTRLLELNSLDGPTLDRLADVLAKRQGSSRWAESESVVAKSLRRRLQVLEGESLVAFEPGARLEPDFYLVYFSAHWCGPCRRFTPKLRETYQALKANPSLADKFELVFVSNDRSAGEQLKYVREEKMPWPVLKYSQLGSARPIERWAGDGIPCLAVVTRDGQALFHSYRGEEYLGPDEPLRLTQVLLEQMDPKRPEVKRAQHPLAVRLHVRGARGGDRQPEPFLFGEGLNPERFRRHNITTLALLLEVADDGRVNGVTTEPALPAVAAEMLRRQATEWLFLSAVKVGSAVETKVSIPLKF